jgi:hypothetical protein
MKDVDLRSFAFVYSMPLDMHCHGSTKESVYQFSGLCYVYGLMDGEALRKRKQRHRPSISAEKFGNLED